MELELPIKSPSKCLGVNRCFDHNVLLNSLRHYQLGLPWKPLQEAYTEAQCSCQHQFCFSIIAYYSDHLQFPNQLANDLYSSSCLSVLISSTKLSQSSQWEDTVI